MKHCIYLFLGFILVFSACKRKDVQEMKTPLTVKNFWPSSGKAGTVVTISGTGFGSSAKENEVSFNGIAATVVDVKDTIMMVLAPEKASSGKVTISNDGKQVEAGSYTYQNLTMRAVNPLNGPAGTNLNIRGEGFSSLNTPAKVTVNGKEATITSVNDTLIVAAVPEAAGTGAVKVTVEDKEVSGPLFTFQHIAKLKPLKGGKGTTVTITGEGFSTVAADNSIAFNGKPGKVVSATATQIVVTTPDDVATGPLSLTINGQITTGPDFTVIPPPVLQTVTPLSSPAGEDITISGKNFSKEADENNVFFNGVKGTVKSATEEGLVVTIPAGAGTGNLKVWVNGQETAGPLFKEQNLGIAKLTPDNGLEGSEVTVTGVGFSNVLTDNMVTLNGLTIPVTGATEKELKLKMPAGISTGALEVRVGALQATGPVFKRAGVMTLVGGPGTTDLETPGSIVVDRGGTLFIVDGNRIKKVSATGVINHFVGSLSNTGGHVDGTGTSALLEAPTSMVIDKLDNIYIQDGNYKQTFIRKITPDGKVATLFSFSGRLGGGIGVDFSGVVYVSQQYQGVFRLESNATLTRIGNGYVTIPGGMAIDPSGRIYYAGGDYYTPYVGVTSPGGRDALLAGNSSETGFVDGQGGQVLMGSPIEVTYDPVTGNIIVIDNMLMAVRSITPGGLVTTITGAAGTRELFKMGYVNGTLNEALFRHMGGVCVDKSGTIYVSEKTNKAIRKIFMK
ncbi:hypothetical protein ECE50_028850 [Chitinophaga sp. Mgbs1]|uniref:Uncharacterized protein n=1 Tax=Chitinophaga solisilvae TaxID=1233460 RepID=A0A433WL10_9BACT|nr:hypothetical protein [Chitinophaga solisilvae]